MAEERGATIVGGVETEVRALRQDVERRFDSLEQRMARMEGLLEGFRMAFDQMDKRISDLASQVDKRLTDLSSHVDRRFTVLQWGIGLLFVMQVAIFGKLFLK